MLGLTYKGGIVFSAPSDGILLRTDFPMAKPNTLLVKLVSTADTGYYYVTKKNPRTQTEKLQFRKYDPVVRKHVVFKEGKIRSEEHTSELQSLMRNSYAVFC